MSKGVLIPNKDLIVYLETRTLVWRVFPWVEKIAADLVDYLADWNILKHKVKRVDKHIIQHLNHSIAKPLETFHLLCSKYHLKGTILWQEPPRLNIWTQWFENPDRLLLRIQKILKPLHAEFLELKQSSKDFQKLQGRFSKFNLGILLGEEREILSKINR